MKNISNLVYLHKLILILMLLGRTAICSAQESTKGSFSNTSIQSASNNADSIIKKLCKLASDLDRIKLNQNKISNQIKFIESQNDKKEKSRLFQLKNRLAKLPNLLQSKVSEQKSYQQKLLLTYKTLNAGYIYEFKKVKYQLYILNDTNSLLSIHHKDTSGRIIKTIPNILALLEKKERSPEMITNAGMYTPEYNPEGLFIEDYKRLFPLNTKDSKIFLNFYMHPNGVFYQDSKGSFHVCTTDSFKTMSNDSTFKPRLATQSGPMLKVNGKIHPKFNWNAKSKKIRSGVGIYNGMCIFAITRNPTNFYDFASFFTEVFNCKNALYLDGVISKLYDPLFSSGDIEGQFGPIISISKSK